MSVFGVTEFMLKVNYLKVEVEKQQTIKKIVFFKKKLCFFGREKGNRNCDKYFGITFNTKKKKKGKHPYYYLPQFVQIQCLPREF